MTQDEFEREHAARKDAYNDLIRNQVPQYGPDLQRQKAAMGALGTTGYLSQGVKTAQQIADEMLARHQAGRDYVSFDEDGTHWSGDGVSVQRNPIHIEGADLIAARTKTHGHFDHVAHFTDTVKLAMRGTPNWHPTLNAAQREALDCIAMKLGRILAGDPNHPDHIDDVIGYATLFKEWSGR